MASLQEKFDPNSVDPNAGSFEPFPAGEYLAQIEESDEDGTKNGKGRMLKFTWVIVDGDYKNRKIWQNINYVHESTAAQQIGQSQLAQICNAVGVPGNLEDTEQLHFVPCLIKSVIEDKKDGYAPKNIIRSVKAYAPVAANDNVKGAARPAPAAANDNKPAQAAARPAANDNAPATTKPAGRPWGNRSAS